MVILASRKNKLDGSVERAVFKFLHKLQLDDTVPGLHIEPMVKARDRRARTGRVNDQWRAVLFKLESKQDSHYVYIGTFPHDEAIRIARTHELKMNTVLGVPEVQQYHDRPQSKNAPGAGVTWQVSQTSSPQESENQGPDIAAHSTLLPGKLAELPEWTNQLPESWVIGDLVSRAGLDHDLARKALEANTESELNSLINDAPEAQGLVLLELANGRDLDEVMRELGLAAMHIDVNEDEQLIRTLTSSSTPGFVFVGDNPQELKDAIESMNIDRWRVFLHPEQRTYVEKSTSGPFRLSGGAGTGKTVVLIHRARHLTHENSRTRVVLTTFTRELAAALQQQLRKLDKSVPQVELGQTGVSVLGIDQIAAQMVSDASPAELRVAVTAVLGAGENSLAGGRISDTREQFEGAVDLACPDLPEELLHPSFLNQEYISVVLANGVVDEAGYSIASRRGRGTALNQSSRKELWKVFAQFRKANLLENKATYPEVAAIAAKILQERAARGEKLPADRVLVDEAQDLHASHWALLRALVKPGTDDLFIAEDSHQRIYGEKVTLSRFGINIVGRSRRLRLNYRTTAENLAFAVGVLSGAEYDDMEDASEDTSEYRSVRSGPKPTLVQAESIADEVHAAAIHIRRWIDEENVDPKAIGVMVRSNKVRKVVSRELRESDVLNSCIDMSSGRGAIDVLTMHNAKGMEFERAIVMGVGSEELPAAWMLGGMPENEQRDLRLRERSLFYVAATRARDELVVTWSGEASEYV
ncbi:3'-5' exonuclease [Citricoccus muralis]|uniref:DNA 3'-5' helicase n=1 Tax=Citricoccus muralis TaxID=169134 RepID=A0ABY8H984_9MICC|nr:3'-5' exonuclease [Citricoccus muralis]WFP17193.1 3'-5' exonuclease [Citricoccus muralis]